MRPGRPRCRDSVCGGGGLHGQTIVKKQAGKFVFDYDDNDCIVGSLLANTKLHNTYLDCTTSCVWSTPIAPPSLQ